MLQLDRITKSYTTGDFTQAALDGVSINFRDNEFVAILGPSGSGKTTLLNIVGGLDHYDNGDLVIDGVSTRQYRDADWDTYRNNRVGFVFQSYNLIPHQNVLANVEMSLTLSGVPKATRHERALAALDAVGLAEHANKRPNQLSGGQAQRVAIARALVNDPTIVLADEPTGALDSKTSVDVMDLLQDIAKDRLVIMVTHNPQLAHQYATRIVEIRDGHIVGDSRPFDPSTETVPEPRPLRRTAMSFMTALALSAKNLLTKKGRTIMTAFAGSIGIIGIALILALATGANAYIQSVEEETLSEYPLQVLSTGFDIGGMFSNMVGDADDEDGEGEGAGDAGDGSAGGAGAPTPSGTVEVTRMVTAMVSGIGANDLASLKAFFDENGGNIHDFARSIEYSYGISPLIYAQIPSGKWQQVNPDTARSAYTTDSLSSSYMASLYSSNQFFVLPENPALYQDSYELVAGRWPADASECILSLPASGRISDYLLYDLGLRDVEERRQLMDGVISGEGASISLDTLSYTYEDLLALTFKVVNVPDTYEFDTIYGIWKAKTDDAAFMQAVIERSADLRMVGIVKPKKDANATMLQSGIFYLPALIEDTIRAAGASEMVQQQLANPEIDVLTGKPFGQADADENSLDLAQIFSVDEAALGNAFSFDAGALRIDFSGLAGIISPERLIDILRDNLSEETLAELAAVAAQDQEKFDAVRAIFQDAMDAYLAASTADPSLTPAAFFGEGGEGYAMLQAALGENSPLAESALADALSEVIGQVIAEVSGEVAAAVQRIMGQMLSRLPNALHIDAEALGSAFQVNMSTEDLNTIIASMMSASRRTFENNLSTFNYADLATPIQIDIYPNDFEAKSSIIAILDQYNVDAIAAGEEDRAINFTDIVGTLMSSVTTIIDVISAMLIAFVSISLVVSSIMIGIITYISVLERKKEIGVLRALGARKRDISRVFNAETVIEGLLAGIFGVSITALLCIPACAIVDAVFGVPRVAFLPFEAAVALVALSVFLTLISGLIPATAASNADPVEALRSE